MSGLSGRQRFVVAVLLVAFIAGSLVLTVKQMRRPDVVVDQGPVPGEAGCKVEAAERQESPGAQEEKPNLITVHVCGAVAKPGVYALPSGSRVADAVMIAGGLTGNASPESVNMASMLVDSTQVYVPAKDLPRPGQAKAPTAVGVDAAHAPGQAPPASAARTTGKVNINTATAAELEMLPGIGPALALRILEFRNVNGKFERPEQLMDVSGIGPKKYAALKDLVTIY
ncbi:MAG: helix-hairpin-helix domain-containing protein [Bacillota bacterium]